MSSPDLDAIIVGGGIAGVWLLNHLTSEGYQCILLEAGELGGAQTLASQGMVHGGIKYALGGALTGASEAIADMPARWRQALAGEGEVDLSGLDTLADRYYLFAAGGTLGKLTGFFASKALRGRIERLGPADYPQALRNFDGVVYGLQDFVLDTRQLLERLLEPVRDRVFQLEVSGSNLQRSGSDRWVLTLTGNRAISASRVVLCAGAGTQSLLTDFGLEEPRMQLRPLHQVLVHHPDLEPLFAHCVTGIRRPEPRLTITTHDDGAVGRLWYLGGQLATDGIERSEGQQIDHARAELTHCVPWLDWSQAAFATLRVDRAEPEQTRGGRPDEAFTVAANDRDHGGRLTVCWPTKLSLAPDLAHQVAIELAADPTPAAAMRAAPDLPLPAAVTGRPSWAAAP